MVCPICQSDDLEALGVGNYQTCNACGFSFIPQSKNVHTAAKRFRDEWTHTCQHCRKQFTANRSSGVKFCSNGCRRKHWGKEQLKPENILKNDPYQLARYQLLSEISASSADVVAHALANQGIPQGIQIMNACLFMPHPYKAEQKDIDEQYQMTLEHRLAKRFAAV